MDFRAREVRRLGPGSSGRSQTVAPARAAGNAPEAIFRRRRDGVWQPAPCGSTLCVARAAPVVDARRHVPKPRIEASAGIGRILPGTIFRRGARCRGAQLPGRPQGEANIPAEQQEAGQPSRVPPPHVDQGGTGHHLGSPSQGPPQPVGLIWSVRDRASFEALRRSGRRVRRGPITVTWLEGDPAEPPRVAYAISRRAGGAVVRNRIRRRLRAIIREVGVQLRPGAYLFGATAAAASLPYGDLRATVCQALAALHRPTNVQPSRGDR